MINIAYLSRNIVLAALLLQIVSCSILKNKLVPVTQNKHERGGVTLSERFESRPLVFEKNDGQVSPEIYFISRGTDYALYLGATKAVLSLGYVEKGKSARSQVATVALEILGANNHSLLSGKEKQTSVSNYYYGRNEKNWITGVSSYKKVKYESIYPGIDLVFYGNHGELEYDFVVQPGVSPEAIKLAFSGADKVVHESNGNLLIKIGERSVIMKAPTVYQNIGHDKKKVASGYDIDEMGRISFQVAEYDTRSPLIIDPILSYATFVGGSISERGNDIALFNDGGFVIVGGTYSTNYPVAGATQSTCGDSSTYVSSSCLDAFITKFNAQGELVFSTYLGGGEETFYSNSGIDQAHAVATDASGNTYVAGETNSFYFPTTPGAYQTNCRSHPYQEGSDPGGNCLPDAFISKLDASGEIVYSTYLGGANRDIAYGIGVNAVGNAFVTGVTFSADDEASTGNESFPIVGAAWFPSCRGGESYPPFVQSCHDAFFAKLSIDGSFLVQSSFLGGSGDDGGKDISVDSIGNAWVTGYTSSSDFLTVIAKNPFRDSCTTPCNDGFVTKISPPSIAACLPVAGDNCGGSPVNGYSTYLGGTNISGQSIDVDASGNAYIAGYGDTIVTTAGAYDTTPDLGNDVFLTKLDTQGSNLVYSTYLGGVGNDGYSGEVGIDVDTEGQAYVAGTTLARFDIGTGHLENTFPIMNAFQGVCRRDGSGNCGFDAFVAKLNPAGSALLYSSYLGGAGADNSKGIVVDEGGTALIVGNTASTDFPVTPNAYDGTLSSFATNVFVAKVENAVDLAVEKTVSMSEVRVGHEFTYTIDVTNGGPSEAYYVTLEDILPEEVALRYIRTNYVGMGKDGCRYIEASHTVNCLFLSVPMAPLSWWVTVQVVAQAGGEAMNTAVLYSNTLDTDTSNNTDSADIIIVPPNTPPGSNVVVTPEPGVSLEFTNVTEGGYTTSTSSTENPAPSDPPFEVAGVYYDISTTATFTGTITVCIEYDDTGMTFLEELALRFWHLEGGVWVNVTSSLDTTNNNICGNVTSLSWFGAGSVKDTDGDTIADDIDNCTLVANAHQNDTDNDGFGNYCDPDLNNDGVVNFVDFSMFRNVFGNTGENMSEDFNSDNVVNFVDFSILRDMLGKKPGPSGIVAE